VIQLDLEAVGFGLENGYEWRRHAGLQAGGDTFASSLAHMKGRGSKAKWVPLAMGVAGALLALTFPSADGHALLAAPLGNPASQGSPPVAVTEPANPTTPHVPTHPHPGDPGGPPHPSGPPEQPVSPQPVGVGYEHHPEGPRDVTEPNVLGLFCAAAFAFLVAGRPKKS
jgi:hypothetical protein